MKTLPFPSNRSALRGRDVRLALRGEQSVKSWPEAPPPPPLSDDPGRDLAECDPRFLLVAALICMAIALACLYAVIR